MGKLKYIYLNFAIFALVLQGCTVGDSSPANNTTQSSPTSDAMVEKDFFVFKNELGLKLDNVVVTSLKNPKQVVATVDKLDCNTSCKFVVPEDKASEDLLFTFFSGNNKKVAIKYMWLQNSRKAILRLADEQLGYYAIHRIKQENKIYKKNPLMLIAQLKKMFANYTDDSYLLIGAYYKTKVVQGGLSEKEFLDKLVNELSSGAVVPKGVIQITQADTGAKAVNLQANRRIKTMSATSDAPTTSPPPFIPEDIMKSACQSTDAISMSDTLKGISSFIPGIAGEALYGLFDYAFVTMTASCPVYGIQDVARAIDALSDRVDQLDKQMVSMNYSIDNLAAEMMKDNVKQITKKFSDGFIKYQQSFSEYFNNFNGFDGEEYKYKDLATFVDSNAGLAALMDNNTKPRFNNAMHHTDEEINSFFNLMYDDDINDLASTLSGLYRNESQITGDIIEQRIKTNVLINYLVGNMIVAVTATRAMMFDKIHIVSSALASGKIDQKWLNDHQMGSFCIDPRDNTGKKVISWDEAYNFVYELTENKLQVLRQALVGENCQLTGGDLTAGVCTKLFIPLSGFPKDLFTNITKVCSGNGAGINKWYIKNTTNTPNVEVSCYGGINSSPVSGSTESSAKLTNSVYRIDAGSNIANVLGAIVPVSANGDYIYKATAEGLSVNNVAEQILKPDGASEGSITFNTLLKSNYPLMLYAGSLKPPVPQVLQAQTNGSVVSYGVSAYNNLDGTSLPAKRNSVVLTPSMGNDSLFYSNLNVPYNFIAYGDNRDPSVAEQRPQVSAKAFLAFEVDGYVYPFSLVMSAYGNSYSTDCDFFGGNCSYRTDGDNMIRGGDNETIALQCISPNCSANGTSITWDSIDGKTKISASISGILPDGIPDTEPPSGISITNLARANLVISKNNQN